MLELTRVLKLAAFVCVASIATSAAAVPPEGAFPALQPNSPWLNPPGSALAVRARAEFGALGVLSHRIRYGSLGTELDYRDDADQNTVFFFSRYSAELVIERRHGLILLYQPFSIPTEAVLGDDLVVGEVVFPAGTATRFVYGFDFYRLDYQYDLFDEERVELAFGAGVQIRNARVSFVSSDGTIAFTQAGSGLVPLLRFRGHYVFDSAAFLESEIDGFITPVPGDEGPEGENPFGSILDASLRAGVVATHFGEAFVTLRYLGGGFRGNSDQEIGFAEDDTWTSNWLSTLIFSFGVGLR